MDFAHQDRVPAAAFNRIVWRGLKGDVIYPGDRTLADTRREYKRALEECRNARPGADEEDE